jgi:hypothetical protein
MDKLSFPSRKGRPFLSEYFCISNQPNTPTGSQKNLHEKRLVETSFCSSHHRLQIITGQPINLQVIPNPLTKVAFKEQMNPIFIASRRTDLNMLLFHYDNYCLWSYLQVV